MPCSSPSRPSRLRPPPWLRLERFGLQILGGRPRCPPAHGVFNLLGLIFWRIEICGINAPRSKAFVLLGITGQAELLNHGSATSALVGATSGFGVRSSLVSHAAGARPPWPCCLHSAMSPPPVSFSLCPAVCCTCDLRSASRSLDCVLGVVRRSKSREKQEGHALSSRVTLLAIRKRRGAGGAHAVPSPAPAPTPTPTPLQLQGIRIRRRAETRKWWNGLVMAAANGPYAALVALEPLI